MLALLADENFNGDIVRGVRRRQSDCDILTIQELDLDGIADPDVLEWAANKSRVVLTHDVNTVTGFAYKRIGSGLPMPGVFVVPSLAPIGPIIQDILLLGECSLPNEWDLQVRYLPL